MGNNSTSEHALKTVITYSDVADLQKLISMNEDEIFDIIDSPLNRNGDSAILLSARLKKFDNVKYLIDIRADFNYTNFNGETLLDIVLQQELPPDGDILNHILYSDCSSTRQHYFEFSSILNQLLSLSAQARTLPKLILYLCEDSKSINHVINILPNITSAINASISGLLIQICVWFQHLDVLKYLLNMGVNFEYFWSMPFMPRCEVSPPLRNYFSNMTKWKSNGERQYAVLPLPDSHCVQILKLAFIQDWRAEDSISPNSIDKYRAGLQLPPNCAIIFICASNNYLLLDRVMSDVLKYAPVLCDGPDLNRLNLIEFFIKSGYNFTDSMITHFNLKFHIEFSSYRKFISEPLPLKHICRVKIRFLFSKNVFYSVSKLSFLPPAILSILTLQDDTKPSQLFNSEFI